MINLTRLNGHRLVVNCDLIKFAEATPDTTLSLITGEKLIVLDSLDDLIERIVFHRARILTLAAPESESAIAAHLAHTASLQPQLFND